jgi:hypothetical protein
MNSPSITRELRHSLVGPFFGVRFICFNPEVSLTSVICSLVTDIHFGTGCISTGRPGTESSFLQYPQSILESRQSAKAHFEKLQFWKRIALKSPVDD